VPELFPRARKIPLYR